MSSWTETLSKCGLADQQPSEAGAKKKQRTNAALAQVFVHEDYGFRPPPGLRDHMSGPVSRSAKKTSPRKLIRGASRNERDPFQYLNDDEIVQIIGHLSSRDTETMRRVSKFWKATSERVLLRFFPEADACDLDTLSSEETNLYYRRQLYFHESLKIGRASRAIQFTGVRDWHLNCHVLMFSNGVDNAAVRTLRIGTAGGTQLTSEDERIEFGDQFEQSRLEVPYLQLTNDGDTIGVFRTYTSGAGFKDTISLMPTNEDKGWHLPLEGGTAIYFIEAPKDNGSRDNHGPAFKKVSLVDGSLLYATFPPEINECGLFVGQDRGEDQSGAFPNVTSTTPGRKIKVAKLDTSLKLTGDETIAVWSDLRLRVYVFSADSGQILLTYDRPKHSTLSVSASRPQFWDLSFGRDVNGVESLRFTSYNERTEKLSCAFGGSTRERNDHVAVRFVDADYPLGFDFLHSMDIFDEKTRDPFTIIGIMGVQKRFERSRGLSHQSGKQSVNDLGTNKKNYTATSEVPKISSFFGIRNTLVRSEERLLRIGERLPDLP
ncbi:MAG: hypothetical protein Q9191_002634 [Dirinaria sp. TL-2023a]